MARRVQTGKVRPIPQHLNMDPAALKGLLPRTWPVFFARHGNFTSIQLRGIPAILEGRNTLLIAATATGKTEAAMAPLLERHILGAHAAAAPELRLLYVCPTRALVRDLYERLALPLHDLGVSLVMKSGDTGPVSETQPPAVLVTTPESTDSLLTRAPRLLATLAAVALDEIHLFDRGVRGDQLRCLLRRIEAIRSYHAAQQDLPAPPMQYVALSATVPDAGGIAARYLTGPSGEAEPVVVQAGGGRRLRAHIRPMAGLEDLIAALTVLMTGTAGLRKALVFCNARNEVEQVAAYLRERLVTEASVFVHYSNLDPAMRREVEDGFAAAAVALCVCTSTLELGIDIGSIDHVVLIGPPTSLTSFLQRIGRGGRRSDVTPVLCLARSALEELLFRALLDLAQAAAAGGSAPPDPGAAEPSPYRFRPSVLVQQIFSLLKQSPTGGVRLADLRRIAPEPLPDESLRDLLDNLVFLEFLRPGGLGEWRPGQALGELVDRHEIYSNIGDDPRAVLVVDAYTGRLLAQTERMRLPGETLLLGGRSMEVVWRDRGRIGVRPRDRTWADRELRPRKRRFAIPVELSQAVAAHLGLRLGQMCMLPDETDAWLFHFWGDIYGELLRAILQAQGAAAGEPLLASPQNEHCLLLSASITALPPWDAVLARRELQRLLPEIEEFLEMGRFHSLLPPALADQAMIDQCDLPRLERLYRAAVVVTPPAGLRSRLLSLL